MKNLCIVAIVLAGVATPAMAQHSAADHAAHPPAKTQNAVSLTEGEVRKVDLVAKKITIRHGPIKNLDMPGMTMVFLVKDSAMLQQVKAGDKIRFAAEQAAGGLTVTRIETSK